MFFDLSLNILSLYICCSSKWQLIQHIIVEKFNKLLVCLQMILRLTIENMPEVIILHRYRFLIFLRIYSLDTYAADQNGS